MAGMAPGAGSGPAPAVWAALLVGLVFYPNLHGLGPRHAGPFSAYVETGRLDRRPARAILGIASST